MRHPAYEDQQSWWLDSIVPEVGDLQRSSKVLGPSLESQSAVGATEIWITPGLNPFKLD